MASRGNVSIFSIPVSAQHPPQEQIQPSSTTHGRKQGTTVSVNLGSLMQTADTGDSDIKDKQLRMKQAHIKETCMKQAGIL